MSDDRLQPGYQGCSRWIPASGPPTSRILSLLRATLAYAEPAAVYAFCLSECAEPYTGREPSQRTERLGSSTRGGDP
jgi:hypothetical protein